MNRVRWTEQAVGDLRAIREFIERDSQYPLSNKRLKLAAVRPSFAPPACSPGIYLGRNAYRSARRVFWIVDGGTIHRGQRAARRLQGRFPNLVLVHLPTHASWLNQIEIYFSILQRKALTPADFASRDAVAARILGFQEHYQAIARPFEWKFTRRDLNRLLQRSTRPEEEPFRRAA